MDNVLVTPHIGYVTERTYRLFYEDTVKGILEWLKQSGRTGIPGGRHEGDRKEK
jgi:phosphoglycerate dehydrogenase-like enzyme